jgi:glycosyltransferase involved in cell wall biosynthesis
MGKQPSLGMSVIIPAWHAAPQHTADHIGNCLDAFSQQDNQARVPLEILVGVDGCSETLEFLSGLRLPPNTRVLSFPENHGPYIVFNTLVPLASHPYVMFFGADDVPYPFLVDQQVTAREGVDIVRQVTHDRLLAYGAFAIWKSAWDRVGGYEPWRCAADYEFITRAGRVGLKIGETPVATFQRGISPNQLSATPETGMTSKIRNEYHELVKTSTKTQIEPETAKCSPAFESKPQSKKRPRRSKRPPKKPTIGASMIVKNESGCLDKCLRALDGIDKIVVVDTGSEDNTPDIAWKYTDNVSVGEYVWKDEFDDARNFALARCDTDWVLSIDADEVLEPDGIAKLREAAANAPPATWTLSCELEAAGGSQSNYPVRFWRNHRGLRFKGMGHETITRPADGHSGVKITYGTSPAHSIDKGRMLRIMTKAVAKEPDNARYKFYLAREYGYRGEWGQALEMYQMYMRKASWAQEMAEARLQMAYCCRALQDWTGAKENCIKALIINAEFKEALVLMAQLSGPNNAAAWNRYAASASNKDVLFVRKV